MTVTVTVTAAAAASDRDRDAGAAHQARLRKYWYIGATGGLIIAGESRFMIMIIMDDSDQVPDCHVVTRTGPTERHHDLTVTMPGSVD